MRIARPWSLELAYTREMMAGLLLRDPAAWPRNALLVGLGAGSLAKFLYRHRPRCRITAVEINPQVERVARQYFRLPDDPQRLAVIIADAADYMTAGSATFDYILVDGFDPDARAGALDTLPFYQACRARLGPSGLLAVNLLGRNRGFAASVERIRAAFDGRTAVFPSCDSGNTIAFACAGDPIDMAMDELREGAKSLKRDSGLDLFPTLGRLQIAHPLPGGRLRI